MKDDSFFRKNQQTAEERTRQWCVELKSRTTSHRFISPPTCSFPSFTWPPPHHSSSSPPYLPSLALPHPLCPSYPTNPPCRKEPVQDIRMQVDRLLVFAATVQQSLSCAITNQWQTRKLFSFGEKGYSISGLAQRRAPPLVMPDLPPTRHHPPQPTSHGHHARAHGFKGSLETCRFGGC